MGARVSQLLAGLAPSATLAVDAKAKALKAAGVRKSYTGSYQIWNPAGYGCQNIDTLEAGAEAAAKVFEKYGFRAYAGSRLD